jgi:hypothetical protein
LITKLAPDFVEFKRGRAWRGLRARSGVRLLPPPAPAPTAAKAAATSQQPNHKQKQDGANGGVDDRRDNPGPEMDAELRQQPATNERADNAYDEIADEPESGPPHDLAGQPAGHKTDHHYDQKTFI